MTDPKGNSEFCFPETLMKKGRKKCEELICIAPAGSEIFRRFKKHDLITCESKVHVVVVYLGSDTFSSNQKTILS